ncbi:MAG: FeoB-associated Cys-rich membrane protein [Clostridium sp.]|nr:FeoB-associated Cys-rich membrane protein [Clostridium sp.]
MIDIIVGLLVVIIIGEALFYIRKEKKKGACVGCPYSTRCQKHHPGDSDHSCDCHTEK